MAKSKTVPGILRRRKGTRFDVIGNMVPNTDVAWARQGNLSVHGHCSTAYRSDVRRTRITKMAPTRRPRRPTDSGPQGPASDMVDWFEDSLVFFRVGVVDQGSSFCRSKCTIEASDNGRDPKARKGSASGKQAGRKHAMTAGTETGERSVPAVVMKPGRGSRCASEYRRGELN